MKQSLLLLSFFLLSNWLSAQGNKQNQLRLLTVQNIPKPENIKGEGAGYIQHFIEEDNPAFNGVILISNSDLSINFMLLDVNNNKIWKKPFESNFVSMSTSTLRIATAGKLKNPGHIEPDVSFPNAGFTVYNEKGEKLFSGLPAKMIKQMEFNSKDDLIVLSNAGLTAYNKNGVLLWRFDNYIDEITFSTGNDFFTSITYESETGNFHKRLFNSIDGQMLNEWFFTNNDELDIQYVNPARNEAFVSIFNGLIQPYTWNFQLKNLNTWSLNNELPRQEACPFYTTYFTSKNTYAFVMARPRVTGYKNAGEIIFAEWSLNDKSERQISLGYQDVNFSNDKVKITETETGYIVRIGSTGYKIEN